MARNIEKNTLVLKLSTLLVDVAELVNGVEQIDFIRIKKDYRKCLTKKKKYDIIVSEREVIKMRVQRGYLRIILDDEEREVLKKASELLHDIEDELYENDANEDSFFFTCVEEANEKLSDVINEFDEDGEVLVR